MYVTNKFGVTFNITNPEQARNTILNPEMRPATEAEIAKYKRYTGRIIDAGSGEVGVYYRTHANGHNGYGMTRDLLVDGLQDRGIKLNELQQNQKVGFRYGTPQGLTEMTNDIRLIYTMFETTKIPDEWPDLLNSADEVIVPSKFCQEVFAKSGVKATLVPLGYDHETYTYVDRPLPEDERQPFTFIHYNSFDARKGFREVFEAFIKEFEPTEPVRLILKGVRKCPLPITKQQYPNIEIIDRPLSGAEMQALLARSNCHVFPSTGEGFGITPLEAMATGIPSIIPNAHGISEYFNKEVCLEVKAETEIPPYTIVYKNQNIGRALECDVDSIRQQMRYASSHQAEMKEKGRMATEHAKQWTIAKTCQQLAEIINKWQAADVPKRGDMQQMRAYEL